MSEGDLESRKERGTAVEAEKPRWTEEEFLALERYAEYVLSKEEKGIPPQSSAREMMIRKYQDTLDSLALGDLGLILCETLDSSIIEEIEGGTGRENVERNDIQILQTRMLKERRNPGTGNLRRIARAFLKKRGRPDDALPSLP